jgi:hypothetical protein
MQKKQNITFTILFVLISLIVSLFIMSEILEYFDANSNFILSLLCLVNSIVLWRTTKEDHSFSIWKLFVLSKWNKGFNLNLS